jgi:hypothetical protein
MKYSVYHDDNPTFRVDAQRASRFPDGYTHVADVETYTIDHVYELTNHIDKDWTTNGGVTPHVARARSTSVGDVVVTPIGAFICANTGWKKLA